MPPTTSRFALTITARLSALVLALMSVTVALATVPPRNAEPPPVAALFDCEVPCFLGIIPGETTVDEAEGILRNHPNIMNVIRSDDNMTWEYKESIALPVSIRRWTSIGFDKDVEVVQYVTLDLLSTTLSDLIHANALGPPTLIFVVDVDGDTSTTAYWHGKGWEAYTYALYSCYSDVEPIFGTQLESLTISTQTITRQDMQLLMISPYYQIWTGARFTHCN